MVILGTCPLVGAPFCGAPVRPNMLNMPKSAYAATTCDDNCYCHYSLWLLCRWVWHQSAILRSLATSIFSRPRYWFGLCYGLCVCVSVSV